MRKVNYERLLELKSLIDTHQASTKDKKEYLKLLYENGNITKQQYEAYLKDQNSNDIVNATLTIGGVLLATWLINKLLEKH